MRYLALAKQVEARMHQQAGIVLLRPGAPDFTEAIARLAGMPLDVFTQQGSPLEIKVPWLAVTLWFVPSEADAEALVQEGVSRGHIWTARELMDLLAIPGLTAEPVQTVARAKIEFNGEVIEVRPRRYEGGGEPA